MKEYYEINREILNQSFISEINENPNNKDDNHMYDTENRNENDDIPKDSKNQNTLKNKKNNISIKLEKQEKGKVKSSYIGKKEVGRLIIALKLEAIHLIQMIIKEENTGELF